MKKILFITVLLLLLTATFATAADEDTGWRCGNLLIEQGVQSFEVINNCGEPNSKEVVGHTQAGDSGEGGLIIEKWIYGPEAGYYYILYFSAGVLQKV